MRPRTKATARDGNGDDASRRLSDARLGSFKLGAGNINITLGLSEALLIGDKRTRSGVGIGFCCVILLFGNFAFFHERRVALEVGLGQFGVGAAFLHVGLSHRKVRGLRLFIGSPGARKISSCA